MTDRIDKKYRVNLQRALRMERRRQQLGVANPKCAIPWCRESDFLRQVSFSKLSPQLQRKLIERHHVGGRKAGDWIVPLCRNHHAKASDWQYDWDERLRFPGTEQERTAAYVQGQAELLRLEAEEKIAAANELEEAAQELLAGEPKSSGIGADAATDRGSSLLLGTPSPAPQAAEGAAEAPRMEKSTPRRTRAGF